MMEMLDVLDVFKFTFAFGIAFGVIGTCLVFLLVDMVFRRYRK